MREARDIMADLASSGLNAAQLALVMELSAAVTAEARPVEDKSAERRRAKDRERKKLRRVPQTSAESAEQSEPLSPHTPLSENIPPSSPTGSIPPTPKREPRATRLPSNFVVPDDWIADGVAYRARHNLSPIDLRLEAEKFSNYWAAKSGGACRKTDWRKTWDNWCLSAKAERNERDSYNGAGSRNRGDPSPHETLYAAAARVAAERGH